MTTHMIGLLRAMAVTVALGATVGACALPSANQDRAPARSGGPGADPGHAVAAPRPAGPPPSGTPLNGIVARGESSGELFEARNIRLVRSGIDELAAQFELYNGSSEVSSPSRWSDPKARRFLLLDLPRGTSYQALRESSNPGYKGTWGRLSNNWMDPVGPHRSITLTVVFAAPPTEARSMLVALGDLVPVEVPVQAGGSPTLVPDPILLDHHTDPNAGPLVCASTRLGGPTQFRLPADVLFAFDSATLSPAAQIALDTLIKQVNGTIGSVTVQGNTDAIGTDAYNQTLSEQRAASVADALKQRLGGNFTLNSVGFGETRPVAPNTNPDGSDNPDGRAQNRRVDIEVNTTNPAPPSPPQPDSGAVRSDLRAGLLGVRRIGGYLLITTQISNPDSTAATFAYTNTVTPESAKGGLFTGELAVQDASGQSRANLCIPGGTPTLFFSYAASMNSYSAIPAGATLTLWGLTPAPIADSTSVNVQIGGFPQLIPARIAADH